MRERLRNIFSGLKIQFPFITYGMLGAVLLDIIMMLNWEKSMSMRTERASLENVRILTF